MRTSFVLIFTFLFTVGLFAADEKNEPVSQADSHKLNPDGSIALIPYNAKQQQKIDRIGKEVDDYHAMINEKIKFLSFEKKIKDSRYGQVSSAREIHLPYEPRYVMHSRFVMKLKGGGGAEGGGFSLDELSFWSRKSLTDKGKDPVTTYRELKNNTAGGVKGLILSVRTVTNADDNTLNYELEKIQSPWERIRLATAYRDRLREVARNIDRYIQAKGNLETRMVSESVMEISVSGDFEEP
ncbi:hypothetical protein EHQ96_04835 [Leptospira levettii]|uniref:Uncharacterized protein n=1 Tax=Leptospira levettii TaxID=2023178 RepID=A0ABY2MPT7_9LEPT|nr:hypothetical protein [Leptospira levettii]MCG6146889.1 hypothetical protein [Leptospira levettii]MCW7474655.1 hypothetical protein [Leptospira levettii]MCW7506968.1 hypothetical protein [Leptospira levettii]MCW7518058.1 hypothetical protein [Leptospira levettii]PJZ38956.1 hypothetical protein CH354_07195 [Leptospira levettii]